MRMADLGFHVARARQARTFDGLTLLFQGIHAGIVLYVALGWTAGSREALFAYLLILPLIVLQWLLNGGVSIVNNFENLARGRQWNDSENQREGTFFQTLLGALGIRPSHAQITFVLCALMLMFWMTAMSRMILIIPTPV
jgi:hypothetical protein